MGLVCPDLYHLSEICTRTFQVDPNRFLKERVRLWRHPGPLGKGTRASSVCSIVCSFSFDSEWVGFIECELNPPFSTQMTNDDLRELNKKRKIHQIAWVTRDLEKSMKAWVDNLKVGPWTVLTFTEKTLKYLEVDGKRVTEPFKFLIGISWIGEIQVELIQPVYGPMIYEAFIQKHGEGLHHFKERISLDDIDEVLKEYKEKGIEVTQTGQFKEDFHYYLNTEPKLDFVLELGNCPLLNLPKNEFPTYPPENA
jgi:methylmalonyl-CoA/ethylmalonyl-CoA epimerase